MSKIRRLRTLPWAILLEAGMIVRGRWRSLPRRERAVLLRLVQRSRGWPANLTATERAELRRLVGRLELKGLAGELAWLRGGRRRRAGQRNGRAGRLGWLVRRVQR